MTTAATALVSAEAVLIAMLVVAVGFVAVAVALVASVDFVAAVVAAVVALSSGRFGQASTAPARLARLLRCAQTGTAAARPRLGETLAHIYWRV